MSNSEVDLGPGSILHETMSDLRIAATEYASGLMLLMHPNIGVAVDARSDLYNDVYGRVRRSLPLILGSNFAKHPERVSKAIVDVHAKHRPPIKGETEEGKFDWEDDEAWYWAHIMIFQTPIEDAREHYYRTPFTLADRERLHAENIELYSRYGKSMDPMPDTYKGYVEKRDKIYEEELKMTKAAQYGLDLLDTKQLGKPLEVTDQEWKHFKPIILELSRLTLIGGLPQQVRERFDLKWSKTDQRKLAVVRKAVQRGWRFVPAERRMYEIARNAYIREGLDVNNVVN